MYIFLSPLWSTSSHQHSVRKHRVEKRCTHLAPASWYEPAMNTPTEADLFMPIHQ